jgi:hypothetical protein
MLRFHIPLGEPDVRISRIRLSIKVGLGNLSTRRRGRKLVLGDVASPPRSLTINGVS